ncbi:hypothetical protein Tco_0867633 [Tanacetum coccineum]
MKMYSKKKKYHHRQKETTSTPENTPTRRTKATAARHLCLQNPTPRQNPLTTPQTETRNVQNIIEKKKMVKRKGKKTAEDDDDDFIVEEPHDEEDDKKELEKEFKSFRERTTVQPLYDAT